MKINNQLINFLIKKMIKSKLIQIMIKYNMTLIKNKLYQMSKISKFKKLFSNHK